MILKPQDILIVLKLLAIGRRPWTYAPLAVELGMSPSQLHSAVKRVLHSRLAISRSNAVTPQLRNLREFLVHGLKYVFVPQMGELARGIPTAHAAPPLAKYFLASEEPPPVWPHPQGSVRGVAFSPLYKLAPAAALADPALYELLVIVDAIRGGRAREQSVAIKQLDKRLDSYA